MAAVSLADLARDVARLRPETLQTLQNALKFDERGFDVDTGNVATDGQWQLFEVLQLALKLAPETPDQARAREAPPTVEIPETLRPSIVELLKNERVIEAVKLLRNEAHAGLFEAKNAVEAYRAELRRDGTLPLRQY